MPKVYKSGFNVLTLLSKKVATYQTILKEAGAGDPKHVVLVIKQLLEQEMIEVVIQHSCTTNVYSITPFGLETLILLNKKELKSLRDTRTEAEKKIQELKSTISKTVKEIEKLGDFGSMLYQLKKASYKR